MNRIWKLTPPDDANSSDINDLRTRSHADRRSDPRPKHSYFVMFGVNGRNSGQVRGRGEAQRSWLASASDADPHEAPELCISQRS